jgi:UDP-N-acetylmuramoyl-L-alanyl-D-glutamate--2,6-diaminopimelate ligase
VVQQAPYWVIVDFGHTPQAFEQILPLARSYTSSGGKLIHMFGCAGERDAVKRRPMGELSGRLADMTVLTTEDPRHETVESIQAQVMEGLQSGGNSQVKRIDDRTEAINWAIRQARPGDVVLLTGKGHETSMNIGGQEVSWNEVDVVKHALSLTV